MKLAMLGAAVTGLFLFTGWVWLLITGLTLMMFGLMFGYRPPQDDVVWRTLVSDGVIGEDGEAPGEAVD